MSAVKYFATVFAIMVAILAVCVGTTELLRWLYHTYEFHPVGIVFGAMFSLIFGVLGVVVYIEDGP